jgi:outer membrane protein assembly factor BamB
VVGVDSDHQGGVWIAYRILIGDYYVPDDVRVVHLDSDGQKLSEWRYTDEFTDVSGIAYDGTSIWLNYNAVGTCNCHIRKIDATTGQRIGSFATETGIVDLDVRGDELLLSNLWNSVIALDRTTGGERWRAPLTGFDDSTQRGIASTEDHHLWVASWTSNKILLLDSAHRIVATGIAEVIHDNSSYAELELAWDGQHLIVVHGNQISWLRKP